MLSWLSIRSKLLLLLLLSGLLCALVTAYVSYNSSQRSLTTTIYDQLTSLREAKKQQVTRYFNDIKRTVLTIATQPSTGQAAREFVSAFSRMDYAPLTPLEQNRLEKFYEDQFLPRLAKNTEGNPQLSNFLPTGNAAARAQNDYISANPNPVGQKDQRIGDVDSVYGEVHERYHTVFRRVIEQYGFYDLFIMDPQRGNIVYSVFKEVDFGTNLLEGPHSRSGLASVYRRIVSAAEEGVVRFEDFSVYAPSYNAPAAFMGTPLYRDGKLVGVLVVQLSIDDLDNFMTSDRRWKEVGLGDSGEVYMVGSDQLLRSSSRFALENPEDYFKTLSDIGTPSQVITRIRQVGTSILNQPVNTEATRAALRGESGTAIILDYRGVPVLSSYSKVDLGDTSWAILAEIDEAEAFQPLTNLQQQMLVALTAIAIFLTLLASLVSYSFSLPLAKLLTGVKRLSEGDTKHRVNLSGRDEFHRLGTAFNSMVGQIEERNETIAAKTREYETLLRRIFPERIANRVREGDETIAESFEDVSVVHLTIGNFEQAMTELSATGMMHSLNDLISQIDNLADRHGIEKIKTVADTYLGACGLPEPRHDHAEAAAEFAQEAIALLRHFNESTGLRLTLQAGVASGEVDIGVVGRKRFVFEILGQCVVQARMAATAATDNQVWLHSSAADHITNRALLGDEHEVTDMRGRKERLFTFQAANEAAAPKAKTRRSSSRTKA